MFGMILFGDVDFFILKFKLHLNRIHYFVQFMKLTFCKCSLQKKNSSAFHYKSENSNGEQQTPS